MNNKLARTLRPFLLERSRHHITIKFERLGALKCPQTEPTGTSWQSAFSTLPDKISSKTEHPNPTWPSTHPLPSLPSLILGNNPLPPWHQHAEFNLRCICAGAIVHWVVYLFARLFVRSLARLLTHSHDFAQSLARSLVTPAQNHDISMFNSHAFANAIATSSMENACMRNIASQLQAIISNKCPSLFKSATASPVFTSKIVSLFAEYVNIHLCIYVYIYAKTFLRLRHGESTRTLRSWLGLENAWLLGQWVDPPRGTAS